MGVETNISWCDHTFNPWRGCVKVSAGCANCYAETLSKRNPSVLGEWGPGSRRVPAAESYWKQPLQWDRQAKAAGKRARVFCLSLGDVFEDHEALPPLRQRLGQLIARTPNLDWLLLTKRPENWVECSIQLGFDTIAFPDNVWIGVSVEDQEAANQRIYKLLEIPAKIRFLSIEPLIGPVDLTRVVYDQMVAFNPLNGLHGWPIPHRESDRKVDWVIVGGESGPRARPCDISWICTIAEHCREARVPCFVKQVGSNSGVFYHYKDDSESSFFDRTPTDHPKGGDPAEFLRWVGEDCQAFPKVRHV